MNLVPCRYCNKSLRRFRGEFYWIDDEGKYYCVSWEHGLIHLPIDP